MIPPNLTYGEVGAFLRTVGQLMGRNDVCADAVLDFDSQSPASSVDFSARLVAQDAYGEMSMARAKEIAALTLDEAINFI